MNGISQEVIQGNCFDILASLPGAYFDAVICDPPYGTTNLPFDKHVIDWGHWWQEIDRVCRPSAVVVCFAAQPFATDLIQSNRRAFRYDCIWQKTQAVGFLSANQRPLRGHEHILIFCRKFGRVKGVMQSTYNAQKTEGKPYNHRARTAPLKHYSNGMKDTSYRNEGTRHPTSVLTFPRDVPSQHPTQKPLDLCRWLVRTYTHPGERVLDPFCGSASTGVACRLEGRAFVGIELDAEYYDVARQRLL